MVKKFKTKMDLSDCVENLHAKIVFMSEACIAIAQNTEQTFGHEAGFGMHLMFMDIKDDVASIFAVIRDDLEDKNKTKEKHFENFCETVEHGIKTGAGGE